MNKNLTPEQKHILHEEGTESPGSSPLNYEKREGDYHCEFSDSGFFYIGGIGSRMCFLTS